MAAARPVHSDPEILGCTPVFVGTRVPFQALMDYLEEGQPLSAFLADFPTVTREQAIAALEEAVLAHARPLDECVPEGRFDVLVTVDQSLPWQQHVAGFDLSVVVLRARSNSLFSLQPLVPDLLRALSLIGLGQIMRLGA